MSVSPTADSRLHMSSSWQAREYRSVKFMFAHERPGRPLSHTMEILLLSADGKKQTTVREYLAMYLTCDSRIHACVR